MSEIDDLQAALEELKSDIREASNALAQYVKLHGDDPIAYAMADRILSALATERNYRRLLVSQQAGY